jgi:hypothetical protein
MIHGACQLVENNLRTDSEEFQRPATAAAGLWLVLLAACCLLLLGAWLLGVVCCCLLARGARRVARSPGTWLAKNTWTRGVLLGEALSKRGGGAPSANRKYRRTAHGAEWKRKKGKGKRKSASTQQPTSPMADGHISHDMQGIGGVSCSCGSSPRLPDISQPAACLKGLRLKANLMTENSKLSH